MTTTLITGANKGLGFETARQLLAAGHDVWMGSRDPERGRTAAEKLGGRFVALDVTDAESIAQAAKTIGTLDVLINNAGISGGRDPIPEITAGKLREVYETNVFGPVQITHSFLPLLEKSEKAVIVYVSSGLGSITLALDPNSISFQFPALAYGSAKAALNMITVQYAKAYPKMRINAVDPGYTATDLNGHQGPQTVAEGAEIIVHMAQVTPDGPTGGYFDRTGALPW
jgi:NAD(P)-dependent dehydrogenase (short-subunit alcohol dehydrogenase family)